MQPYEIPAFAALKAEQRRLVWNAVVNGALEGWEPTVESVTLLCEITIGAVTSEEYLERVLARAVGSRAQKPQ